VSSFRQGLERFGKLVAQKRDRYAGLPKSLPEGRKLTLIRKVVAIYGLDGAGELSSRALEMFLNLFLTHATGATTMYGVDFCGSFHILMAA